MDINNRPQKKRCLSPSPSPPPSTKKGGNNTMTIKCSKCSKLGRKTCSQKACSKCCSDLQCEGHRDVREKDLILNGTHPINIQANAKRALTVTPNAFHDPAFHYLGESILIWSLREYMANSKWREDAIRKSLRNIESRRQAKLIKEEKEFMKMNGTSKRKGRRQDGSGSESINNSNSVHAKVLTTGRIKKRENRKQRFRRIMNQLYDNIKDDTA